MPQRFDTGTIGDATRTQVGGLLLPAYVTRVGVFEYTYEDGSTVKEFRSPETVFDRASLDSMRNAPVTDDHPSDMVDPSNWRKLTVGTVCGDPVPTENKYILATLAINDADIIKRIESKELREISMGYSCDVIEEAGEWEGEKYTHKQVAVFYNHVALGGTDWGRAGPEVRLRIDAKGNQVIRKNVAPASPAKGAPMVGAPSKKSDSKKGFYMFPKIRFDRRNGSMIVDGVTFDLKTDKGRKDCRAALNEVSIKARKVKTDAVDEAALKDLLASAVDALNNAQELLLANAEEVVATDAEEEEVKDGDDEDADKVDEGEEDPEKEDPKMDKKIQARIALLDRARAFAPKLKVDSIKSFSLANIAREAIKASGSAVKLDGKNGASVLAMFEVLESQATKNDKSTDFAGLNEPATKTDSGSTGRQTADQLAASLRDKRKGA